MEAISSWLDKHSELLPWVVSLSIGMFVASLIAVPLIAVYMRADYFLHTAKLKAPKNLLQLIGRLLKNLAGVIFLVMGIGMLVLPGQGILTLIIGMSLLDFPGKRRLQLRLVRFRSVHRPINWLRHKAKRDPLVLPPAPETRRSR